MKNPLFQHIYLKENKSYNILTVERKYFVVPWHFHPEIEIMLILDGEGTRFVGDNIENFSSGDLVVVGENIPHCWKSSLSHYQSNSSLKSKAIVLLFRMDCFGENFFKLPEFERILLLLEKAKKGICFSGATKEIVAKKIKNAANKDGIEQFILLIEILNLLANCTEYRLLATQNYQSTMFDKDMQRLNPVLDYLIKNFKEEMVLENIASQANMSSTAFCRYFKARTNKTVMRFVIELKVSHAMKLLMDTEDNITNISYESGFNNASHFFEQFKKVAGISPKQYRKKHRESRDGLSFQA